MFASGGSEANELAMRITRQYHLSRGDSSRWKMISLEHSYHGATVGALSMTGKVHVNDMTTSDYAPYLIRFPKIPPPALYRGQFSRLDPEEAGLRAADTLAHKIEAEGPETIAGFIVEPIMGNAGMIYAPPGYLRRIREICDEYGIVFIVDEVMTGAGRTGRLLCSQHHDVAPDLATMAKALSGGYMGLSAVLVHDRIAESIAAASRRLDHVHTYSGHPLACAVGTKALDILQEEGLIEQSLKRGEFLRELLCQRLGDLPCFGDLRGVGLANALELVADRDSRTPYPLESRVSGAITMGMRERGFLLSSGRFTGIDLLGDVVYFTPPFIITEAQIAEAVDALGSVLEENLPTWERG